MPETSSILAQKLDKKLTSLFKKEQKVPFYPFLEKRVPLIGSQIHMSVPVKMCKNIFTYF
jgi:hypothetical protein